MNPRSPALQALSQPDFARYAFGRLAGTLAWQMINVVVGFQVWKLTRDPLDLGFIGLAQFLPFLALVLPGGQLADRFDRRTIIACAYTAELTGAAILLWFTLSGSTHVNVVFGAVMLLGIARAFWAPAGQAMTPNLVPKHLLPAAVTVNAVLFQVGVVAGPSIGGVLAIFGYHVVYGIACALLAFTVLMVANVRPVLPQPSQGPATQWRWHNVLDGFRFVVSKKPLLGAISLDLFAVLFGGATALLPVFATDILHVDSAGLGLLRAAPGVGAAIVALSLSLRAIERHAGRWMFGGVVVFGVATITFGLSTNFWLSLFVLALLGAGDMVSVFVRQLLVQLETPDAIRGRVSAVNSMFIGASNELGEFESGVTAKWFGTVRAVVLGGFATLIVVGSYMKIFPELRKLDRFPEPRH
ncbi:MAG TPA: MFS transporter [Steroidobacteraceae bacterium]|jgi:MFS family permease|nr:MFS transporter [Steroidobacteraceae bacterium]